MNGAALESRLVASLPELRGKLKADAPLKDFTWFRAGGPAEVLYSPADEADLAYFLRDARRTFPSPSSASVRTCWCATAASRAW